MNDSMNCDSTRILIEKELFYLSLPLNPKQRPQVSLCPGKKVFPNQATLVDRISVSRFGESTLLKWLGTSMMSTIWRGGSENLLKGSQIDLVYPRSIQKCEERANETALF